MDRALAERIALKALAAIKRLPYRVAEERAARGYVHMEEYEEAGQRLQVETQYLFDSGKSGPVRIIVAVDDGGLRAIAPLTWDTLIPERTSSKSREV